jgi:hypothetical protein
VPRFRKNERTVAASGASCSASMAYAHGAERTLAMA